LRPRDWRTTASEKICPAFLLEFFIAKVLVHSILLAMSISFSADILNNYSTRRKGIIELVQLEKQKCMPKSQMSGVRVCSLFSGLGGFEYGIRKALGRDAASFVFASDINTFAQKAYRATLNADICGDITKIASVNIPDHDILVAGFPCQAFSAAGKRLGFNEVRGTLFGDVARILLAKQPKICVLENVKGLVNHDGGDTIQTILQVLSDIGYAVDFSILNAKNFGLPQNRERAIIVGTLDGNMEDYIISGTPEVRKRKELLNKTSTIRKFNFVFPTGGNTSKVISDILEPMVDEKYFLPKKYTSRLQRQLRTRMRGLTGERTLKQLLLIPKQLYNDQERQRRVYAPEGVSPTLLARPDAPKIAVLGQLQMQAHNQVKNVYSVEGISPTLDTAQGGHRQVKVAIPPEFRIRKLTPLECFRVQGFSDTTYKILRAQNFSDTQLYKLAGNAVPPPLIAAIFKQIRNLYL
jgi:DNA (cytosine-5)-methyltransferase 1